MPYAASGECFAGDGNTLATGGEGISIHGERLAEGGERFAGGGGRIARGGNELAADGGGVAAARWASAPPSLFASRQTAGDELAHLRDFGLGEQLDGSGFVGGDDGLGRIPVEVREVGVGGILSMGQ